MSMTLLYSLLVAVLFAGAVFILLYAFAQRPRVVGVQDRLEVLSTGARKAPVKSLQEVELSRPFAERVLVPTLGALARIGQRLAPGLNAAVLSNKLAMAGNPSNVTVEVFVGLKIAATLGFGGIAFVLQALRYVGGGDPVSTVIWSIVGGAAGFFFPDLWLRDKSRKRQKAIVKALPDTIDVLSISVEAGLAFDSAIGRIVAKTDTPLTIEFEKYLTEIRLGKGRREALRMIQTRTGVEDLNAFISAIIQADQLGVSIAKVLRLQSEQLRIKRRQRAEQLAQQAPLKMLFPMILFIFPAVFVVILGPSLKEFISAGI